MRVLLATLIMLGSATAYAQLKLPEASPAATSRCNRSTSADGNHLE